MLRKMFSDQSIPVRASLVVLTCSGWLSAAASTAEPAGAGNPIASGNAEPISVKNLDDPGVVDPLDRFATKYGKMIHLTDLNKDGRIDDRDLLAWLRINLSNYPVRDLDGSNSITQGDGEIALARYLAAMQGDFNGNGVVDASDLAFVTSARGTKSSYASDGDVNGDGIVDDADVAAVAAVLGSAVTGAAADAAALMSPTAWNVLSGGDTAFASSSDHDHLPFYSRAYPGPVFPFPPNHDINITNTWYPSIPPGHTLEASTINMPPGNHQARASYNFWPPNHYKSMSDTWHPTPNWPTHFYNTSSKERNKWPPNHIASASGTWPDTGPNQHQVGLSRIWPPSHNNDASLKTPDHHQYFSLKPDWQPNKPFIVPVRHPSDHLTQASSTWPAPGVHATNLSKVIWPPNHIGGMSSSWPDGHKMLASTLWPPNHFGGISSEWPGDSDPQWPANHAKVWSDKWPQPAPIPKPPWGDHSLFQTGMDIIPLLPKVSGQQSESSQ